MPCRTIAKPQGVGSKALDYDAWKGAFSSSTGANDESESHLICHLGEAGIEMDERMDGFDSAVTCATSYYQNCTASCHGHIGQNPTRRDEPLR